MCGAPVYPPVRRVVEKAPTGWTLADPANIGRLAISHQVTDHRVRITGVTDDLRYYWGFDFNWGEDTVFLPFQVEIIGE